MKIRKLGDTEFFDIDDPDCAFCEAGRSLVVWDEPGIIFLENRSGAYYVARVLGRTPSACIAKRSELARCHARSSLRRSRSNA